jgi:hypothetical protein
MKKHQKRSKVPWQARQGDVLIERKAAEVPTAGLSPQPREDGGVVLAHGEVTGHKHQLRNPGVCELRNESSGERILVVDVAGLLEHEEHVPPIEIGAGHYEIVKQCEWDYTKEGARAVAD